MHSQAKYFHAFNCFNEKIGPAKYKKLVGYFGDLQKAWQGTISEYIEAGIDSNLAQEISLRKKTFSVDEEFEKVLKLGVDILTIQDEIYPKLLKEIHNPPFVLYKKGEFAQPDEFSLAIVGSRKLTSYGQQAVLKLAYDLAEAGLVIVSGLAQGVDTLAHRQALAAGSRTLAVIGSGIDDRSIFPSLNRKLAWEVSQNGVLLSEYPPGAPALKHHFPARNRILSGLALGTLIVEATERSGALITARHALEQNREVFAVPGSILSKNSVGPNNLIKLGAKAATRAQDILEELNLQSLKENITARQIIADSAEESLILEILTDEPIHVDKIIRLTKLDTATTNSVLSLMEIKGKIRNLGGANYVKR